MNGDTEQLPEGWALATLDDGLATSIQPGFACGGSNREGTGIPHLRPMNVSAEGRIALDDVKFVPTTEAERDERQLKRGDVLFNNTNSAALVGKTAYYDEGEPRAFSNHMTRVRTRTDVLDPRYCAMVLHQRWREQYFEKVCNNHVGQASISRAVLAETPLPIPPLAEQRRIVAAVEAVLARVSAARERLNRVPAILKRFRQAVLSAACSGRLTEDWRAKNTATEPIEVLLRKMATERECVLPAEVSDDAPTSWMRATFGFLVEQTLRDKPYITSGSRGWAEYVAESGPYFIRSENINTDCLRLDEAIRVNPPEGAEAERTRVRPGDLLLTITGNNVGRTAVVPADCPTGHVSQHVAIIRFDRRLNTNYLWLWLRSPEHGQSQLTESFYGETKPGLNLEQVRNVLVDLPPLAEQQEIVSRVGELFALADVIESRLADARRMADQLTQAVLAKAFRGELVPTEAELARREQRTYEPAAELLARIRAEREQPAAPANGKPARKSKSRKE